MQKIAASDEKIHSLRFFNFLLEVMEKRKSLQLCSSVVADLQPTLKR